MAQARQLRMAFGIKRYENRLEILASQIIYQHKYKIEGIMRRNDPRPFSGRKRIARIKAIRVEVRKVLNDMYRELQKVLRKQLVDVGGLVSRFEAQELDEVLENGKQMEDTK